MFKYKSQLYTSSSIKKEINGCKSLHYVLKSQYFQENKRLEISLHFPRQHNCIRAVSLLVHPVRCDLGFPSLSKQGMCENFV